MQDAHGAPIDRALARAPDTRRVAFGESTLAATDEVFVECFGERPAVVVADERTFAVAGGTVDRQLRRSGFVVLDPLIFPADPPLQADYRHVEALHAELQANDAIPVAVGSGTINDLVKLAAHLGGRPYMAVATAASMDGYAAFGAAITRAGFKQTFPCPAPRAIVADLDVLADAPLPLTASGYADLLGKVTAGADWLIADALDIEPLDPEVWSLVQGSLPEAVAAPERLQTGDRQAVARLFVGLILSGLAMQAAQSSRPASGSEHQFSHLWEMDGLTRHGQLVSHGFKVGIGTLAVAALYERLLESDLDRLDIAARVARWPSWREVEQAVRSTHANPAIARRAIEESRAKYVPAERLAARLALVRERWPALRERLRVQLLPVGELRRLLQAAGCATDPEDIGLTRWRLRASYAAARQIRRRYTVLDLAAEAGELSDFVDELFKPGGYWGTTVGVAS